MKKLVLVVDGFVPLLATFQKSLGAHYTDQVDVATAEDAGQAMEAIRKRMPDMIVTEIALAYGEAYEDLEGWRDSNMIKTGFRFIEWAMNQVRDGGKKPSIFITSTKELCPPPAGFLGQHEARFYNKPYDTIAFELDFCRALEIPCVLPPGLVAKIDAERGWHERSPQSP